MNTHTNDEVLSNKTKNIKHRREYSHKVKHFKIVDSLKQYGIELHNTDTSKRGYIMSMLDSLLRQLCYMIDGHSKLMMVRIDLHFPLGYNYDEEFNYIREYNNRLMKKLNKFNTTLAGDLDAHYFWTMEQTPTAELPHYHTVLFFNGHLIRNVLNIYKLCSLCWKSVLKEHYKSGLVHCPTLKYIGSQYRDSGEHDLADQECIGAKQYICMLRFDRDASIVKEDVGKTIRMLSYLCKSWSKSGGLLSSLRDSQSGGSSTSPREDKHNIISTKKRCRTYGSSELKGYTPRIDHVVSRTHGTISRRMIVELFDLYDPTIMSL